MILFGKLSNEDIKRISPLFLIMCVSYVTLTLLSNIISGKIISVFGYYVPAGVLIFPLLYILSDIMTETMGMRLSMIAIRLNALSNIFMAILFYIVIKIPYAPFWNDQNAYSIVLGMSWRMVIASVIGTFIGDYANSVIVSIMKIIQKGKYFSVRAVLSTIVGQFLDSSIFITITFFGIISNDILWKMIITQYLFKVTYEIICLPITIQIIRKIKNKYDYYDKLKYETYKF